MDEYSWLRERLANGSLDEVFVVVVEWDDAFDYREETWAEWPLETDKFQPVLMRTVGYIIGLTDNAVIVCGTVDLENEKVSTVSVIPKGCIRTITTV